MMEITEMDEQLKLIDSYVYQKCELVLTNFIKEEESKEYYACQFNLNDRRVICRNAKITPKKVGQFVTFWKRSDAGPIAPFHENDHFDLFVVNIQSEKALGQFVFPKSELIKRGLISTDKKEGKRAFRVYPIWDEVISKQAIRTQKWQLNFFYEINESTDYRIVEALYR